MRLCNRRYGVPFAAPMDFPAVGLGLLATVSFLVAQAAPSSGDFSFDGVMRLIERLGSLGILAWVIWYDKSKHQPAAMEAASLRDATQAEVTKARDTTLAELVKDMLTKQSTEREAERRANSAELSAQRVAHDALLAETVGKFLTEIQAERQSRERLEERDHQLRHAQNNTLQRLAGVVESRISEADEPSPADSNVRKKRGGTPS